MCCFPVACPRLDENDGNHQECTFVKNMLDAVYLAEAGHA